MKTYYYFLLILCTIISTSVFAQSEYGDGALREKGYRYNSWDNTNSVWRGGDSSIISYDANGNDNYIFYRSYNTSSSSWDPSVIRYKSYSPSNKIVLYVDSFLNSTNYIFSFKDVYVYDSNDSLQIITQSKWNTSLSSWQYNNRVQYSYTATGKTNVYLLQNFNGSSWVNSSRVTYSYNSSDQLISALGEQWNTGTSSWQNYSKTTYTNDANGNVLIQVNQLWNTTTNAWVNSNRTTNTYNSSNYLTSQIVEGWITGSSSWLNSTNESITYNSLNIISHDVVKWWNTSLSSWKNHSQYTLTFDANNIPATQVNQNWDDVNSVWVNNYQYTFTYNNHHYQTFRYIQSWNTTLNSWGNTEQDYYWFENNPLSISNPNLIDTKIKLYPNPASDNVIFETNFDTPQNIDVYIIDASGKLCFNTKTYQSNIGMQLLNISTKNLSSGQYSVIIKAGDQNIVKPLLIMSK